MIRTPLFEGVKKAMRKWEKAHSRLSRVSRSAYKEHAKKVSKWDARRPDETDERYGERIRSQGGDVEQSIYNRVFAKHQRRLDTAAAEEAKRRAKLERAEEKKRQKALRRAPTPALDPLEPAKIRTVAAMTQIAPRVRMRPKKLFPLSASVMHGANLTEADNRLAAMARQLRVDPHDHDLRLRYAQALRRAGRGLEGDMEELHALGHQRAAAHDQETHAMEARGKALARLKKARQGTDDTHREALAAYREAHNRYAQHNKIHDSLADRWHELASSIHAQGGNPALAYHKPEQMDDQDHRAQLVQHIANRNQVTLDPDDVQGRHRFYSRAPWEERRDRVIRAAREARDALAHHHPDTNPELSAVTHGEGGRTRQDVHLNE